jgi:hypothetical protein
MPTGEVEIGNDGAVVTVLTLVDGFDGWSSPAFAFGVARVDGDAFRDENGRAAGVTAPPPDKFELITVDEMVADKPVGPDESIELEYNPPFTYRTLYANIMPGCAVAFPNTTELLL